MVQVFPGLPENICSELVEFFQVDEETLKKGHYALSLRVLIDRHPNLKNSDVGALSFILSTLVSKGVLFVLKDGMTLDREYLARVYPCLLYTSPSPRDRG